MGVRSGWSRRFHETLEVEAVYWNLYADPMDAREKLDLLRERYSQARPHLALVAADPGGPSARVLTPHEAYAQGYRVNPPKWSQWVGWLQRDQETAVQSSERMLEKVAA